MYFPYKSSHLFVYGKGLHSLGRLPLVILYLLILLCPLVTDQSLNDLVFELVGFAFILFPNNISLMVSQLL